MLEVAHFITCGSSCMTAVSGLPVCQGLGGEVYDCRVNPQAYAACRCLQRHATRLSPNEYHLQLDVPDFTGTSSYLGITASVKLF